ncbi:MAG: ferrochelatase [Planctomycetota bacterium]
MTAEDGARKTGVLLANLGTPDAPTPDALRTFLREFLWDKRVIDLPRWKWWLILNLFVLPFRPKKSAALYERVWTPEGSPLLLYSLKLRALLADRLPRNPIALGMRYGTPTMESALAELESAGCKRVVLLPLYPQYSAATTASTFDAMFDAVKRRRVAPELRTIASYCDDPAYIDAVAASIRESWERHGEPQRLLFSFHGIPQRYADSGDIYPQECERTAAAVASALKLPDDKWRLAYQSRFGREVWLQPYTDETLRRWGAEKLESVDVVCPGFAADCLETIDEIGRENREEFEAAGGGRFRYIPALNDRKDHAAMLAGLIEREL